MVVWTGAIFTTWKLDTGRLLDRTSDTDGAGIMTRRRISDRSFQTLTGSNRRPKRPRGSPHLRQQGSTPPSPVVTSQARCAPSPPRLSPSHQQPDTHSPLGIRSSASQRRTEHLEADASSQLAHYFGMDSIIRVLQAGDVVLVKGSWLLGIGRKSGVLPRRQELPNEAIYRVEDWHADTHAGGPQTHSID